MWIFVYFDIPRLTPLQRKSGNRFPKELKKLGFEMRQYSIYTRHIDSDLQGQTLIQKIKKHVPENGVVEILELNDKQYQQIHWFIDGEENEIAQQKPFLVL